MIFKPGVIKSDKLSTFKKRVRIYLALQNKEITDKCLEVLYWIIHFSESDQEFKNSHRIHTEAAKKLTTYPSYVGSYTREHLESKGYVKREEFIPEKSGSRKVIKGYKIQPWLLKLYSSNELKMELELNYE